MTLLWEPEQASEALEGAELPEDVPPRRSALTGMREQTMAGRGWAFVILKMEILCVSGGEETADGGAYEAVPRDRSGHRALGGMGKKMLAQGPLSNLSRRWCGKKAQQTGVRGGDKPGSGGVSPVPHAAAVGFGDGLPRLVRSLPTSSPDMSAERMCGVSPGTWASAQP